MSCDGSFVRFWTWPVLKSKIQYVVGHAAAIMFPGATPPEDAVVKPSGVVRRKGANPPRGTAIAGQIAIEPVGLKLADERIEGAHPIAEDDERLCFPSHPRYCRSPSGPRYRRGPTVSKACDLARRLTSGISNTSPFGARCFRLTEKAA